jgi:hypothetical protein
MGTPARRARGPGVAEAVDADAGQARAVDVVGERLGGALGWDGGAVGAGGDQVAVLVVGGPGGAGGEPLFELASAVVVEDGEGAGVEGYGAFAVVALGVVLPDGDAVGDRDGLADGEA